MSFALCILAALLATAPEVPVFDDARREFLGMTPSERRAKFTDAEWRNRVGKDYARIRWRAAREGESSRWRRMDGVLNVRDLGGLKGLDGKTVVTWPKAEILSTDKVAEITYELEDHTATFTVGNTVGVALPNTGGAGTTLYTLLGAGLVLAALALLLAKRRHS